MTLDVVICVAHATAVARLREDPRLPGLVPTTAEVLAVVRRMEAYADTTAEQVRRVCAESHLKLADGDEETARKIHTPRR